MQANASSCAHASSRLATPLAFLTLIALALNHAPLHAQSQILHTEGTFCTAADLDTTFRFGNYPPSSYVVAVLSRNISTHDCALLGHIPPTFYANHQPTPQLISICLDCDQPHPLALPPIPPPVTLHPGQTAHQTIRWSTSPASPSSPPCQIVEVLNVPINRDAARPAQLVAPSFLPPICSQVAVQSFALGPVFGDDDSLPDHAPASPALRLTSYRVTYYPGESFNLRAESGNPTSTSSARGNTRCPEFLLRQRAANGATRLEEFNPRQLRCMTEMSSNADPDAPYLTATFDAVPPIQPIGDATLQLFQLGSSLHADRITLTESNPLTLHISDTGIPTRTVSSDTTSTLTSTATFTPTAPAPAPTSDLTAYTGWQTTFTLTDTSFGKRSALLDQSTHLEWLRLSASRNKSQDALRHTMAPHKALDGWRFATDEEVVTFFRHFTGSSTGRTSDPAIESELQRLLGGPLTTLHSTPGNWTRGVTNGRIAGYYAPTSDFAPAGAPRFQYHYAVIRDETRDGDLTTTVTPNQTGWSDGDTTSPDTGTFLVREH